MLTRKSLPPLLLALLLTLFADAFGNYRPPWAFSADVGSPAPIPPAGPGVYQCALRSKVYDTMSQLASALSQRTQLADCNPNSPDAQTRIQLLDTKINQLNDQLDKDKQNAPPMPKCGSGVAQEQNLSPGGTSPGVTVGPNGPIPQSPGYHPTGPGPMMPPLGPDSLLLRPQAPLVNPDSLDDTPPDLSPGSGFTVPIDPNALTAVGVPTPPMDNPSCQPPFQIGKPFFALAPNGTAQECFCLPAGNAPPQAAPSQAAPSRVAIPPLPQIENVELPPTTLAARVKGNAKCQRVLYEGPAKDPTGPGGLVPTDDTLPYAGVQVDLIGMPPMPYTGPTQNYTTGFTIARAIQPGQPLVITLTPVTPVSLPEPGNFYSYAHVKRQVIHDQPVPVGTPLCKYDKISISVENLMNSWAFQDIGKTDQDLADWTALEGSWSFGVRPPNSPDPLPLAGVKIKYDKSVPGVCWDNSITWVRYYMVCQLP
ncbi:hypothetical protein RI367_008817 [Sorochytrium milnesiophthora]